MRTLACAAIAATAAFATAVGVLATARADAQVDRGKYLVTLGGCNDCHTPGYFFGKPDMTRYLGGSDVGFEIPGLGAFAGGNITPDKETGIGNLDCRSDRDRVADRSAAGWPHPCAHHAMASLCEPHKG